MMFIDLIFRSVGYYDLPQGASGWLIWLGMLGLNIYLLNRWQRFHKPKNRLRTLLAAALLVLTPITALFLGIELSAADALPVPGKTLLPSGASLMFFAAIPWCLAAGFLGPGWTGFLAGFSGAILGFYDSHNLFTPLIYFLLGMVFSWLIRQQYRTLAYRLLRIPVLSGLVIALVYPLLFILATVLVTSDALVVRLGYAVSQLPVSWAAFAGQLAMGVAFVQVLALVLPQYWSGITAEEPSPVESSLEANLVYRMVPLVGVFALILLIILGALLASSNRRQLISQMENMAMSAGGSIPFSLETGQNLIVQLAEDSRLTETDDPEELERILVEYLNRVPFFNQLTYLDQDENLIAGYPLDDLDFLFLTLEETQAIEFALNGIGFQSYSLKPEAGESAARLVFVVSVQSPDGQRGVILGRTSLDQNPFFIPVLENLDTLTGLGGAGILIDEQGMVMYHPDQTLVGTEYPFEVSLIEPVFDPNHTASDGTSEMLYSYPVPGRSWAIITSIPVSVPQQAALELSLSLLVMLVALMFVLFGGLRLAVRTVTREIGKLAQDAEQIAAGELELALETDHVDEVGQLAQAVDGMRLSLKARMEEVDQLLTVSKGVASSLDLISAVQPILDGALSTGASSARLVLAETATPEFEADIRTRYGDGPSTELYQNMDQQIMALASRQPEIVLHNPSRARLQNPGNPLPEAVLAVALEHEGVHYGALWIAFDDPHQFTEEERRFLRAVAGQAALAVSNARLYLSAQLGRQRMEAILASTPEPVIVTDFQNRFLLVNPSAQALLGRKVEELIGQPVVEVVQQKGLRALLVSDFLDDDPAPKELSMPNDRIYFATASPVVMEDGKRVGRVCLLRDITHYKELDELKSEFVDTVNHDLRSPLTTIRGYATMLDMVGDLNEQQSRYVKKITDSVERMYRLVNTLLDIGRIEAGVDLKLEWLPLADVVRQVAEDLRLNAVQKRIDYKVALPEETMPMVQADRALMEQAIQNVIDNAIKFTEGGGAVTVSMRMELEYAVIEVKDTGAGVSPVDLPRLFERFYRGVDRQLKTDAGSGLGLAIVKSIIERHNGKISVDSRLGAGSTFTLRIPLRQDKKPPKN